MKKRDRSIMKRKGTFRESDCKKLREFLTRKK